MTDQHTPRAVRWCTAAAGTAGAVAWLRVQLGPWPAALVIAPAVWGSTIAMWWRAERRPTGPALPVHHRAGPVVVERTTATHVEFARGLAGVAAWYLDACEADEAVSER